MSENPERVFSSAVSDGARTSLGALALFVEAAHRTIT